MVIREVARGRQDKDENARIMFGNRTTVGHWRIHRSEKRNSNVVSVLRDGKSYTRDRFMVS